MLKECNQESQQMKIIKSFFFTIFLCLNQGLIAQSDIPVGTWRTHFSYNHVIDIALGKEKIYCAASNAVFVYDKTDQSVQTITKLNGLSGGEISAIAYLNDHNTLIIGYQDGNIDLILDNVISSISTIKTDNFTTDKRINSIYILNNRAYLAADFGISVIDLQAFQIKETIVNLGPDKIHEIAIHNDSLFAATTNGVISASLDPTINILDFHNWKTYNSPTSEIVSITVSNGELYIAEKQGSIYRYDQGNWIELSELQGDTFIKISPSLAGLLIIAETGIWEIKETTLTSVNNDLVFTPNEILQDNEGILWIADQINGLIKLIVPSPSESIIPSGPFSDRSFHTVFIQDQTFVLSGGISENNSPLGRNDGYYKFEDGQWENYNEAGVGIAIPQVRDLNDIAYNQSRKQFALASFQDGVLLVNEDNSSIVVDQSTPGSSLTSNSVSGIVYANEGLWILNYGEDKSVHHLNNDGTWQSFSLNSSSTKYPLDIMVAKNNDKWLRLSSSSGGGVFVFNEESGKQRFLNTILHNGRLPSSEVHAITEDLDGLIWVGTSRGVIYFKSSSSVDNNNNIDAIIPRISISKVGVVPLLRDEKVLSIAVDAGNRKWLGTENGVWLFDENGEKEIGHFSVNNSPLPSNKIISISINSDNGEVFFATDQGVVSYRGTATKAEEIHQSVKIFPNPITKDFNGLVSISGLANNAIVKITDISGKLIRQMKANGGSAIWNVQDYRGNRASTGIYLVFSASEDGKDSFVGKIAVVN